MVDLMDLVRPANASATLANGAGYAYFKRYEWIAYPSDQPDMLIPDPESEDGKGTKLIPAPWWRAEFVGFRARILVNPNGAQLRYEQEMYKQHARHTIKESEYLAAVADRVAEWDIVLVDEAGERAPLASPKEMGWEAFLELPPLLLTWLMIEVRTAHLPKAMMSGGSSAGPPASATDRTPDHPDPALPTSSSKPPDTD